MYCVKCGVKLSDTESKCPLCETTVYHPEIKRPAARPLYPENRMPARKSPAKALGGAGLILYLIPLAVCLFSDLQSNGTLDWFGYVAGALAVAYITFALPLWFKKPNPVIFAPCSLAAIIVYLLYINMKTGGNWFWGFALPVAVGLGLILCAVITLMRYLRRGWLYIIGGAYMALGGMLLLIEYRLSATFSVAFIGWSVYPLLVLVLLGGLLIYLAINRTARETLRRKLFF